MKGFIQKVISHNLARGSAIVFVGSMVGNVAAYLYHLLLGRLLGPVQYGELSSLFSVLYIGTAPLIVAQTVLVKFVSGFKAHGQPGQAKSLFWKITKLCAWVSLAGFPVALLAAPWISSFLHLSSPVSFILAYALFAFSLLTIPTVSMLQGYQKFAWVSALGAGVLILKLLLSVPSVAWGIQGVLIAALVASALIYILYFLPMRFILYAQSKPTQLNKRDAFRYAVPTFLTLLGITSLYSTDIILVRHFLAASDAGLYAALAVLGKIIFFASSSVIVVLFPVLSERSAKGENTKKLIGASVGGVSLLSFGLTLLYFLFPDLIVGLLFGNAYAGAGALLGLFGVFLALFSVGNIIAMACLALGRTGVWTIVVLCALLQIAGIALFHENIQMVIQINIAVCALFVVTAGGYYLKTNYEKV
jgi:O-antigen/teichoic acid export membrane protein